MASTKVKRHWDRLAEMGCIITGLPATMHHCHGGSMIERGIFKAGGKKTSDWLVIPLAAHLHYLGSEGIDAGKLTVDEWEGRYGTQADYLDEVVKRTGIDVWQKALDEQKKGVAK